MKILAIDTSTSWMTVALLEDSSVLAEAVLAAGKGRGEALAPLLEDLLARAGMTPAAVEAYAVGLGPGSFTGLRTGLAFARGLSLVHERPVAGVSTLETLALAGGYFSGAVVPVIDAKKGQVFTARFRADGHGNVTRETEDAAVFPNELSNPDSSPALVLGDGLVKHETAIATSLGPSALIAPPGLWVPRVSNITRLALARLSSGSEPHDDLSPIYVRHSDADLSLGIGKQ